MKQQGGDTAAAVQAAIDVKKAGRLGDRLACAIRQAIEAGHDVTPARFDALLARLDAE